MDRAGQYAYRDRKVNKRTFRSLWIQRINAAAREEGLTYSEFIHGLNLAGVEIDRKVLADIAGHDPAGFKAIAEQVQHRAGEPAGRGLRPGLAPVASGGADLSAQRGKGEAV